MISRGDRSLVPSAVFTPSTFPKHQHLGTVRVTSSHVKPYTKHRFNNKHTHMEAAPLAWHNNPCSANGVSDLTAIIPLNHVVMNLLCLLYTVQVTQTRQSSSCGSKKCGHHSCSVQRVLLNTDTLQRAMVSCEESLKSEHSLISHRRPALRGRQRESTLFFSPISVKKNPC